MCNLREASASRLPDERAGTNEPKKAGVN